MRIPLRLSGLLALSWSALASAQDPALVGSWSAIQDWGLPAVHAHLLPSGQVMWWPEFHHGDEPHLWDPATNTNTALPPAGFNIFCSGHAFTADGRLFVSGGHIDSDVGLDTAAIYAPSSRSWSRLPLMNDGRWYPTNTTLPNGDMLALAGTISPSEGENEIPQVWEMANSRWRTLSSASLSLPTYPWTFVAPNGRLFVAGPHAGTRYLDPRGTGSWSTVGSTRYGLTRRYGSAVMYDHGKVLIAGGDDPPIRDAEVIDLLAATPVWRTVPAMAERRRQLNLTLLPDGTVLVTGGHDGTGNDDPSSPVLETELWNPSTERFTLLAPSTAYRGYHSIALLLPDGRVLSAGTADGRTAQIFSPPYLFRGARPVISSAPTEVAYGEHFSVGTANAADIAQVNWVRLSSVTHSFNMNQRFNRLAFSGAGTSLDVQAPDSPERCPPGHYLMFLLNQAGVPSVAKVVRIGGGTPPPPPPPPPTGVIIPFGSTWKYDNRNVNPGTTWMTAGFNDSAWASAPAELGYGDGDEATVLPRGNSSAPTVYFRKKVTIGGAVTAASFRVRHDDGVAVWLNGRQVFSEYLRDTTHASYARQSSADNELSTGTLPLDAFVVGENTVAVMVKQVAASSSDLSFDFELSVTAQTGPPPAPTLMVHAPNGGEVLTAGSTAELHWMSTGSVGPVKLELSLDDGATWSVLAASEANDGSFAFTVPSTLTAGGRVRVTEVSRPTIGDVSDGPFRISAAPPAPTSISFGAEWRYDDRNVDPGAGWTALAFNDSAWATGRAQLGYGDGDEATVVRKLSPSAPSLYFRKLLSLPTAIGSAELEVLHDDGFAVWVNGALVGSKNVGRGLAHAVYASASSADNERVRLTVPGSAFRVGDNLIAVMVKQVDGSSSDTSFDLSLIPGTGGVTTQAIPLGSTWRYDDANVDRGTAWRQPGFDDSAWATGPAQLGYGDGDEATLLRRISPSIPSVYFRRTFQAPAGVVRIEGSVLHDDGVAVYVNGTQVFAALVGDVAHAAYATGNSAENARSSFTVSPSLLVAGSNTIAVVVKQSDAGSSDTSFDLSLTLTGP